MYDRGDVVMSNREELRSSILDIEIEMLEEVPVKKRPPCQDNPKLFRIIRGAQFADWSEETLQSYYNDLLNFGKEGKNLMTLKYARMDNLIECLNLDPLVEEITNIQFEWLKEIYAKYPNLISQMGRPLNESAEHTMNGIVSFKNYLRSELETYSSETLKLLHHDIMEYKNKGINMVEDIYLDLMAALGFNSLEKAEELAKITPN